jgi:hypothetical protein
MKAKKIPSSPPYTLKVERRREKTVWGNNAEIVFLMKFFSLKSTESRTFGCSLSDEYIHDTREIETLIHRI